MTMVGISSNNIHSQSIVMDSSNEQNVAAMIAATQRFSNKTTVEQELVNASLVKTFNPNLLPHSDQAAVAPLNLRELFISPSIANGRAARSSLQEHTSRRCSRLHQ